MSIRAVTAKFECDGCGKPFEVYMDPAEEINGASIMQAAEEEVRSSLCQSIQADMHLCQDCTRKVDLLGDGDYQPTRDEIVECLGGTL